jgi:hypothetical protein
MFAGHYGPAFAAGALKRPPSMAAAFVAVQLVDFAWAGFVLTGVEHARVTPGFLAMSDLDLYDMPYTHSLAGALAWSVLGALVYRGLDRKGGWTPALAIGALVFSHWLLDLLVHARDLALYPGSAVKLGLGWWDVPALAIGSELAVFVVGVALYLRATIARNIGGTIALWLTAALMLAVWGVEKLGPPLADINQSALSSLGVYTLFAALGLWLDRARAPRQAPVSIG